MVTINDIAKLSGVSRTTVSRVLNNSGYVSEKAKKRVLEVIKETGYVPSEQAKSLRTKKSKVIGVILPKISTETSSRVVDGIDRELSNHGYHILLANANLDTDKEIEHFKLLQSRRVDGIILVATNIEDRLIQTIKDVNVPVVALGQDVPGVSSVLYDDYHAAFDVTSLFIKRGHKRIGFIGVDETDRAVGYERKKAYFDAMEKARLNVDPAWVQKGVFDIESGEKAMLTMLADSKEAPTAIFAVTDRLAIGAMQALKKKGIKIPEEMSVMGIGASDLSKYVTPSLSTVDYYNEKAGTETAKLMIEHIKNITEMTRKLSMSYGLIIRDSLL
ncbi:LacI family DNA-binding transcriptional regulator [Salipaludibacillus aurantiacus]|uniref:LacI family transcriptional regulator, sucrose operon repressor n=1 Tax=Salipaludibacillus aurantiacus TaxID=1601833 RepID=A0A1H9WRX6_9BACI|nr:LacI family DNA-binding transcriptional regulator [Salipaludibacillus aurantiacus]SES36668.1 LacI family transcriptional regulator, sucrose operon repressor [Salipaludibacillus aurantiacus]